MFEAGARTFFFFQVRVLQVAVILVHGPEFLHVSGCAL